MAGFLPKSAGSGSTLARSAQNARRFSVAACSACHLTVALSPAERPMPQNAPSMITQRRRLARRVPPISELLGRGSQSGSRIDGVRLWARKIKRDVVAVWIAARDNRVRWYVKALAASVAAYALSPIDLIPDFIPILGYLDDLVIVPLGILLAVRLVPPDLMAEFREEARRRCEPDRPRRRGDRRRALAPRRR